MKLFTGNDAFGDSVTLSAGSSKIEPGITPSQPVALTWATLTDAANQARISRRDGGIHFKAADLIGREIGRLIGYKAFIKAERLWSGLTFDS